MTNTITFEQFARARDDKLTAVSAEQVQAILDTFTHDATYVALADSYTLFAMMSEVAEHRGFMTPVWLNLLSFHSTVQPDTGPYDLAISLSSRLGKWLGYTGEEVPILDIKGYPAVSISRSDTQTQLLDELSNENVRKLEKIREDYIRRTRELVWSPGVFLFSVWKFLIDRCQVSILEHADDKLTVKAQERGKMGVVDVTFHLDAICRDHVFIANRPGVFIPPPLARTEEE